MSYGSEEVLETNNAKYSAVVFPHTGENLLFIQWTWSSGGGPDPTGAAAADVFFQTLVDALDSAGLEVASMQKVYDAKREITLTGP